MMIEKYIEKLLLEKKQAVIAGLGELVYLHRSASVVPDEDGAVRIRPPWEELVFRADEKVIDNGLSALIVRHEHFSREDSKNIISEYVKTIKNALEEKGLFYIQGVGTLLKDNDAITFRPDEPRATSVTQPALPEPVLYPLSADTAGISPNESRSDARSDSGKTVLVVGFFLLLTLALSVVYGIFIKRDRFTLIEAFENAPDDTLQVREKNTQRLTPDISRDDTVTDMPDTVSQKTGAVYLIAGSFKTRKGAEDLMEEVKRKAPSVKPVLILPAPRYPKYKVAVWAGHTKEEAAEARKNLAPVFGQDIWIFEY